MFEAIPAEAKPKYRWQESWEDEYPEDVIGFDGTLPTESRTDNPTASIHENHWCEHPGCDKWGCSGFARSKAEKPTWHCSEHYPHKPFNRD